MFQERHHMCGCALELNMNSFIRAEQKGTPNTKEARARVCTHKHTPWFLFHLPPTLMAVLHSKIF